MCPDGYSKKFFESHDESLNELINLTASQEEVATAHAGEYLIGCLNPDKTYDPYAPYAYPR
jgi:hypothetical protein